MTQDNNNELLVKLMDSISALTISVTRIEETVKPISSIKTDMDNMNRVVSEISASTKSAHHRLDQQQKEIDELPSKERVDNLDERMKKQEDTNKWFNRSVGVILIGAFMGLILVNGGF